MSELEPYKLLTGSDKAMYEAGFRAALRKAAELCRAEARTYESYLSGRGRVCSELAEAIWRLQP